jgi:hypothetical protein
MNPSFKPPQPITENIKRRIYVAYNVEPDLRRLSAEYGISIKRVDAIVRLKRLEEQWKQVSKIVAVTTYSSMMSSNRLVLKTTTWL